MNWFKRSKSHQCLPISSLSPKTWLTENIPDNVVSLPKYSQIFRADRNITQEHRRGGRVLILARDGVTCRRRQDLESWPECVWIETSVQSSASLFVGCIYCPPSTSLVDINTFTACLEDSIEKIGSAKDPLQKTHIALIGDFNATSPEWCATDKYNRAGRLVEDTFLRMGLHQLVDFPTHIHPDGGFGSLLDFLVSSDKMISDILSLPPLGKSDHISLLCNFNLRKDTPPKATHLTVRGKTIWSYERADHDVVSQALKEAFTDTWNFVRNAESIDDA